MFNEIFVMTLEVTGAAIRKLKLTLNHEVRLIVCIQVIMKQYLMNNRGQTTMNNRGQTTINKLCYWLSHDIEMLMPRRPRIVAPGIPLHLIQRGNNHQACFFAEDDYLTYLEWLEEYASYADCKIHAYVLMTNHVHILLTPDRASSTGEMMKRLGQRYVQYINRSYRRSGTLWEGRFRSCIAQEDNYLLHCQQYIEMNPVRADMVEHPGDYRWSSYRYNAQGEESQLLQPHFMYKSLGKSALSRQSAYRALFKTALEPGIVDEIRSATNGNFAVGNKRFKEEISKMLDRRVEPGHPGRPKKVVDK